MTGENDNTLQLHIDQLRPNVKAYAENLIAQVEEQIRTSGFDGLDLFVQRAKTEDIRKVAALLNTLNEIRRSGELPKLPTEFNEEEFNAAYEDLLQRFCSECNRNFSSSGLAASWLEREIPKIPFVPAEVFINDPQFLQKLLTKSIDASFSRQTARLATSQGRGSSVEIFSNYDYFPAGFIFNNSVALGGIDSDTVYQVIDLNNLRSSPDGIGFRMGGGVIELVGNAGQAVGARMRSGKIIADRVDGQCGVDMWGGEIIISKAGSYLGQGMMGGLIIAQIAAEYAGELLAGGEIRIGQAGRNAGNKMINGLLIIGEAQSHVGYEMEGGEIRITKAGSYIGNKMKGGEIIIDEAGSYIGSNMKDGTIRVKKAGAHIGLNGMGGKIFIDVKHEGMIDDTSRTEIYQQGVRLI